MRYELLGSELTLSTIRDVHTLHRIGEALARIRSITTLRLLGGQIGAIGFGVLSEALKQNRSLSMLELDIQALGSHGMRCLADLLAFRPNIVSLLLREYLEVQWAEPLTTMLETPAQCHLRVLRLNGCRNTPTNGVVASRVVAALLHNRSVTELDLQFHWVSSEAAAAGAGIAQLIAQNRTITNLTLRHQCLNQTAMLSIWPAVLKSRTLKKLDLSSNFFRWLGEGTGPEWTPDGWTLADCPLEHLSLAWCTLQPDCIIQAALSLARNTALRNVDMSVDIVGPERVRIHEVFVTALASNLTLRSVQGMPNLLPYLRRNEGVRCHRADKCRLATIGILGLKRRRLSAYKMVANEMIDKVARLVWHTALDEAWGNPPRRPALKKTKRKKSRVSTRKKK